MSVDDAKLEALSDRIVSDAAAAAHAATVVLGDRLGLYRALADSGPQTAEDLAERTGCQSRLVEEWLAAQAVSGYCERDARTGTYRLTPEQAACLAGEGLPSFLVPFFQFASSLHKDEERVSRAFSGEEPFGWHDHHGDLLRGMGRSASSDYADLVSGWIPALDGVEAKLVAGARVADVGCGYGAPTVMLAEAFPASTFCGFDYHEDSIVEARKAAAEAGVSDRVTFEVAWGDEIPGEGYDLVCAFDAIHDMGDPVAVGRRIREVLAPDGTWLIAELAAGDRVEDNVGPVGRFCYSASTFVCVPNALSQGATDALGAQAGETRLREVATRAGFTRFRRATETPLNIVLEARP
jgi:SAM-dependent methyltransferase